MLRVVQVNLATQLGFVNNVPLVGTKVDPPVVTARWVHTKTNPANSVVNCAVEDNIRIHQVGINATVVLLVIGRICEEKVVHIAAPSTPVPIVARGRNGTDLFLATVQYVQWASTVVPRRLRVPVVQ